MFRSLVNLLFGGETKQYTPVDSAIDGVNVQELGDYSLEEDYIPDIDNNDDQDNTHNLVDIETNDDDDDWLLVNVFPEIRLQPEEETGLNRSTESQPRLESSTVQDRLIPKTTVHEISPELENIIQENGSQSEGEVCLNRSTRSKSNLENIVKETPKNRNVAQETSPQLKDIVQAADVLDHIKSVKPQQKARELNVRKCLAPSQIDRQNKVKLYEGKAKNNRRKDLWRCHSGANNNRKCC